MKKLAMRKAAIPDYPSRARLAEDYATDLRIRRPLRQRGHALDESPTDDLRGAITDLRDRTIAGDFARTPSEINDGLCISFALIVFNRIRDAIPTARVARAWGWGLGSPTEHAKGHYWIEHGGRHYDAERPDGVGDWLELPFFATRLRRVPEERRAVVRATIRSTPWPWEYRRVGEKR